MIPILLHDLTNPEKRPFSPFLDLRSGKEDKRLQSSQINPPEHIDIIKIIIHQTLAYILLD
jgi:hypothetical protein